MRAGIILLFARVDHLHDYRFGDIGVIELLLVVVYGIIVERGVDYVFFAFGCGIVFDAVVCELYE